jgi:hypothetical protein
MNTANDGSSVEQSEIDAPVSTESETSTEAVDSKTFIPPSLLYLTLTLLPDDQHSDGRSILPGIHSPDEVAHFFPMFRENQLDEVRSHLPDWISEYEQVLIQRQIERAKAEAAKPKPTTTTKPKSSAFNPRPAHVQSSSKSTTTKEVRGAQRSLFDLSP